MDIRNYGVDLPDIDFGWEPRALAPDLKNCQRKNLTENIYKKNNSAVGNRESVSISPNVEYFLIPFFSM